MCSTTGLLGTAGESGRSTISKISCVNYYRFIIYQNLLVSFTKLMYRKRYAQPLFLVMTVPPVK